MDIPAEPALVGAGGRGAVAASLSDHSKHAGSRVSTTHGHARIVCSAKSIDEALWKRALRDHCMDHRYYELTEATLEQQFHYRYAILTNERTGAVAIQPFFLVDQDITAGLPGHLRSIITRVRSKFPRFLNMKIVMVGCTAGAGHLDCADPWAVEALQEAVDQYAKSQNAPIILFKDFPAHYRASFAGLAECGYSRVPSMPAAKLELDFKSFEEYMETRLSRIYRKNLRRKFRDSKGLGELSMEVAPDVTPWVDEIYPLYLQTFHRSKFQFERLTKEYFSQLGQRLPERVRFFLWRKAGRVIAFSACMIHGDTLHDLNVGFDYSVALDLHLYFVTWRDIVSWAIGANLRTYHTGPLNYDPKLHLRLDLAPQDLYARHTSPLLNPIFVLAIKFLQPVRHDPVLRKFANAHEL